MKRLLLITILWYTVTGLSAQTISDGFMMPKNDFCTGFMYGYDHWKNYWEGTLMRDNGNIGTVTTQSLAYVGVYGVSRKVNAIVMLPYVKTHASLGTLHGMDGIQDISISAKYRFVDLPAGEGVFRAHGVLTFSTPLSPYTPDFLPMSIGLASTNVSWRLGGYFGTGHGFYFNASAAYTWRSNVTLDRSSYFTDGNYYLSGEVRMPNVADYFISAGYKKGTLTGELEYIGQNTLGGGDIRRQDMPFVSNRMNFGKVGGLIVYEMPKPKNFVIRAGANYTLAGRNVGQSYMLFGGLLYTFHFSKNNNSEKQ
jgi:hypothetical protein